MKCILEMPGKETIVLCDSGPITHTGKRKGLAADFTVFSEDVAI